jgi:hypothetical protein
MTTVYFENEDLPYDHDNEHLHSYELGNDMVVPNVGDFVNFDDDSFYEDYKRKTIGTKFIVTKKTIGLSRMEGCVDDCFIELHVELPGDNL